MDEIAFQTAVKLGIRKETEYPSNLEEWDAFYADLEQSVGMVISATDSDILICEGCDRQYPRIKLFETCPYCGHTEVNMLELMDEENAFVSPLKEMSVELRTQELEKRVTKIKELSRSAMENIYHIEE